MDASRISLPLNVLSGTMENAGARVHLRPMSISSFKMCLRTAQTQLSRTSGSRYVAAFVQLRRPLPHPSVWAFQMRSTIGERKYNRTSFVE
jgi:hypothetical protein